MFREHSDKEWEEMNTVAALLPDVEIDTKTEVEDETGLYEGDVVLLTVTLTRANVTALVPDAAVAPAPAPASASASASTTSATASTTSEPSAADKKDAKDENGSASASTSESASADATTNKAAEEEDSEDEEDDEKIFALAQRPDKKKGKPFTSFFPVCVFAPCASTPIVM